MGNILAEKMLFVFISKYEVGARGGTNICNNCAQPGAAATVLKVKEIEKIKPSKFDNEMADHP
jgi:hypothetical protein